MTILDRDMHSRFHYRLVLGMLFGLVASNQHRSYAQSFTPITPISCPRQQAWVWDSNGEQNVELNPYNITQYHNNQTTVRHFVANTLTGSLGFRVTDRSMNSADNLKLRQFGRPIGDERTVDTVNPADIWVDVPSGSLYRPVDMTFTSDFNSANTGFRIEHVHYCPDSSAPPGTWGTTITSGERYSGVLQGTNDVVYLGLLGATSGYRMHIATWEGAPQSGAANVDVYIRCGALPTPTVFLRRANTASSREFLHATSTECPSTSTLYIAIHAAGGASTFNVVAQRHGILWNNISIAAEGMTPAELTTIRTTLTNATRYLYGATEGEVLIGSFNLVNVAANSIAPTMASCANACIPALGLNCGGCFVRETGTPFSTLNGGRLH